MDRWTLASQGRVAVWIQVNHLHGNQRIGHTGGVVHHQVHVACPIIAEKVKIFDGHHLFKQRIAEGFYISTVPRLETNQQCAEIFGATTVDCIHHNARGAKSGKLMQLMKSYGVDLVSHLRNTLENFLVCQ